MPWYAIHTKSRHEELVNSGLTSKFYHAFLPKIEVWSKRKDRRKRIHIPMFPGYLFVELDRITNENKLDILKTFGVVRILGKFVGHEPIPIPDEKIDAIQRLVSSKVEVRHFQYPKVGETARIIDGPFKGIEGTVLQTELDKELFVISVDILQRSVAIRLQGFQIEKLS
jgi:transcription antitermination factor NusG